MSELLDRIAALGGAPTHDLDELERTLTDGYACALSLEAERWRLERRAAALGRAIETGDTAAKARELGEIARRLEANRAELAELRGHLAGLRRRVDDLRVGSPTS